MRYRTLPNTELQLSAIALGCWAIGGRWWGDDVDDSAAIDLIRYAWQQGITTFDTAPLYGYGHADELLREALGGHRHDAQIISKVGVRWQTTSGHPRSDLSPQHIFTDTEASLRRLGIDRIPLLLTHWPCEENTPIAATLQALEKLREVGKIGAYGLCNVGPELLDKALSIAPLGALGALQTPYSMVRRDFESELRQRCGAHEQNQDQGQNQGRRWRQKLGVLAYEPLCRGLLSGKFCIDGSSKPPPPSFPESDLRARDPRFQEPAWSRIQPLVQALRLVGDRLEVPPAALAIAWVLRQPGISIALCGAKRRSQLRESLRAMELLHRERVFTALAPFVAATRP